MTAPAALYRTVVRVAAIDANTITLVIPASNFDRITFTKEDPSIPRWLLDKETSYRFFAMVNILTENPEHLRLEDCEHDPRTVAEQLADADKATQTGDLGWVLGKKGTQ